MTVNFWPAAPIAIRDGTASRLVATNLFAHVFTARTQPTKDDQLPVACVWHAGERTQADGDPNTGAPGFVHTLTLAIDVLAKAGTEAALDADIVALVEQTRLALLTDSSWIALFEGIDRCDTRYSYPKETNDFLVQALIEIEVTLRSRWAPVTPNDLRSVAVFTPPPGPASLCRFCGAANAPGSPECRRCQGPMPPSGREPLLTTIAIESCP